jgi:hypothetical protein
MGHRLVERDVHDGATAQEFIEGYADQKRRLPNTVTRDDDSDVSDPKAAVKSLFQ